MEKKEYIRVRPGKLEFRDIISDTPLYLIGMGEFYEEVKTREAHGRTMEAGEIISSPIRRAIAEYTYDKSGYGPTEYKNILGKIKIETFFDTKFKKSKINEIFLELISIRGIGVKSAVSLCIGLKGEIPDLKFIYGEMIHKDLFIEYGDDSSVSYMGRTDERSSLIPISNARGTSRKMAENLLKTLKLKHKPSVDEVVDAALSERSSVRIGDMIMDKELFEAEKRLGDMISEDMQQIKTDWEISDKDIEGLEADQLSAFTHIVTSSRRLQLLQGMPGSGKSHLIVKLYEFYKSRGSSVLLLSYMNKAARNLSERIPDYIFDKNFNDAPGVPTIFKTYYKLSIMEAKGTLRNIKKPAIIIVDESSVVSSSILSKLMDICDMFPEAKLLLVGDKNQLPPVCAYGTPFHNLMRRGDVDKVYLSIFKRSAGFGIGKLIDMMNESNEFDIEASNDVGISLLRSDMTAKFAARNYMEKHIGTTFGNDIRKFGCIAETRELCRMMNIYLASGHLGVDTDELSFITRKDKKGDEKKFLMIDRPGMRVVARDNVGGGGKFTGDVATNEFGVVETFDRERGKFSVRMDCGRRLVETDDYKAFMEIFEPAYCTTVHKYQGSEADYMMYVMRVGTSLDNQFFQQKELKYVGLSRAKKKLVILAIDDTIKTSYPSIDSLNLKLRPIDKADMLF